MGSTLRGDFFFDKYHFWLKTAVGRSLPFPEIKLYSTILASEGETISRLNYVDMEWTKKYFVIGVKELVGRKPL